MGANKSRFDQSRKLRVSPGTRYLISISTIVLLLAGMLFFLPDPKVIDDWDGDGIADELDPDDDNDGIPDSVECPIVNTGIIGAIEEGDVSFHVTDNGNGSSLLLDSVIIKGKAYSDYIFPDTYSTNISVSATDHLYERQNNSKTGVDQHTDTNFESNILPAFQNNNLKHYQSYDAGGIPNSQYYELSYTTPMLVTDNSFIIFQERLGNNPYDVEVYDDQYNLLTPGGSKVNIPTSDYVGTGVNIDFDQEAMLVLKPLSDFATEGSYISHIRVFAENNQPLGDGKVFIILNEKDVIECPDTDGDGIPNYQDIDSDNDGLIDEDEYIMGDSDADGIPDYLDIDSDDDGITDNTEAQSTNSYISPSNSDNDQDGLDDAYDDVNSFGGNGLSPVNSDTDLLPDYLDGDSDDDSLDDELEAHDTNYDYVVDASDTPQANKGFNNATDADEDGLSDGFDNRIPSPDPTNGGLSPFSHPKASGTLERAWRTANISLPVEWLYFHVELEGDQAKLEWATSREENSDYFEIERSADGANFIARSQIKAAGNSNEARRYEFQDNDIRQIGQFRWYYRLKQVDLDGAVNYSSMVEVNITEIPGDLKLNLYPNPTSEEVNIDWEGLSGQNVEIQIIDQLGKRAWSRITDEDQIKLSVADWERGLYFVQVKSDLKILSRKLVLQ